MLSACGSSGGSSSNKETVNIDKTGILIDNVVSGVKYVNKTTTGFTDSNGEFKYTGGKIEFFLGTIKLGELDSLPSDNKVFIQDLVKVNRDNTSDVKLLKIAKLLQSLDSTLSTDEIDISQESFDKFKDINKDISDVDLLTLSSNLNFTLKDDAKVKKHLKRVLVHHNIIEDKTPPSFNLSNDTFTTTVGNPLTLKTVKASDDIDENVNVTITGDTAIDFNTAGTYPVTYTASDSAGNSSSITHIYEVLDSSSGITHKGITYKIVTSPITGRQWLDRNLGATMVCSKSREEFADDDSYVADQKACFGDLYQWGRLADGHEKRNSSTSTTRATDISSAGNSFIKNSSDPYDWVENTTQDSNNVDDDGAKRKALWGKTDGSSICPKGFRVPTLKELKEETTNWENPAMAEDESIGKVKVTNRDTAFKNFLKFPVAGYRSSGSASLIYQGDGGFVWSSLPNGLGSQDFGFGDGYVGDSLYGRADGLSVRCIRK